MINGIRGGDMSYVVLSVLVSWFCEMKTGKPKQIDLVNPVDPVWFLLLLNNTKMKHEEITHQIIGCAYRVHNALGFGFLETVYKKSMVIELKKSSLEVAEEKPLKVYYDDHVVGDFYVDLLVAQEIVVELKSVRNLVKEHEVQLVNYLNGLKKEIGLLINFGPNGVEVKRKHRQP
jgi:GxxExxY protein